MPDILLRFWRKTLDLARRCRKAFGIFVATSYKRGREELWRLRARCEAIAALFASLRSITVSLTVFLLLVLFTTIMYHDCTEKLFLVEPFSVPPELQTLGYHPSVMANLFIDQVQGIAKEVEIFSQTQPVFTPLHEPTPDLEVPDTGLSLRSIVSLLRRLCHATTERVSADAILTTNGLQLTLRVEDQTSHNSARITGRVDQMDMLMRAAAEQTLAHVDPSLLSVYFLAEDRPSEAIEMIHSWLNKGTVDDKAAAYVAWGMAYMLQTNYDAATTKFTEALRIQPGFVDALNNLAVTAWFQGQLSNSANWSELAIKSDPRDAAAFENLGIVSLLQSNYDKSLAMDLKASQLDPSNPQIYANLAAAYIAVKKYPEGIIASERAVELDPDLVTAYRNLGALYYAQSNFPSALAAYQEGLTAEERNERSRGRSGQRSLFRFVSVTSDEAKASKPTGTADLYDSAAAALSAEGKHDEALELLKKAVAREPDHAPAYYHLADFYFDRGDYTQALEQVKQAIRLDPTLEDAYSLITLTLERLGNYSELCTYMKQATDQEPTVYDWWYDWGQALDRLGDPASAQSKFKRASELNPTCPDPLVNWGEILRQAKDFNGAIDKYKRAIGLNPKLEVAFFDLGICYLEQRDCIRAIEALKRSTELDPKSTMAYVHWAEALEELGDYKAAAVKWQEALQISPHLFEHSSDEITEFLKKHQPIP